MRNAPSLLSMLDRPGETSRVIMPWEYVRLRRKAAGLTIEQAARPYWCHPEHRADAERNIRRLEEPDYRLSGHFRFADMSRSFPFSVDVYRQLCLLPPHQHPALCHKCGWDEHTGQYDMNGDYVTWSRQRDGICSRCEQIAPRRER
jgi:hypothetical protein